MLDARGLWRYTQKQDTGRDSIARHYNRKVISVVAAAPGRRCDEDASSPVYRQATSVFCRVPIYIQRETIVGRLVLSL